MVFVVFCRETFMYKQIGYSVDGEPTIISFN